MRSEDYSRAVMALKNDPLIWDMAAAMKLLGERENLVGISGEPLYSFVKDALMTYQERGGKLETHISGPAEAILELLDEWTREEKDELEAAFALLDRFENALREARLAIIRAHLAVPAKSDEEES